MRRLLFHPQTRVGQLIITLGLLLLLPLVGLLTTASADIAPDKWILSNLVDDPNLSAEQYSIGVSGTRIDHFSDCIGITIGLGDTEGDGPIESAIRSSSLGSCATAIPIIDEWSGERPQRNRQYFRYWHGYSVVTRPLIAIIGLTGTRIVTAALLGVAAAFLVSGARRQYGWIFASCLAGPIILTTGFIDLPSSLPHALSMLTIVGTSAWAFRVARTEPGRWTLFRYAVIWGALISFVELLYTPAAALGLVTFITGAHIINRGTPVRTTLQMLTTGFGWSIGFIWMWATKWALAAAVFGVGPVRTDIKTSMGLQLTAEKAGVDPGSWQSIAKNVTYWREQPLSLVVTAILVGTIIVVWVRNAEDHNSDSWYEKGLLLAVSLVPLAWYALVVNHSQVHFWFTFRGVAFSVGMLAAMFTIRRSGFRTESPGLTPGAEME